MRDLAERWTMEISPETNLATFGQVFAAHRGYLSDKWEHYLAIYEAELGALVRRGGSVNLLEIGVQNGGSLEIWKRYLPPGSLVVGIDKDERCCRLTFPDGISFVHADATLPEVAEILKDTEFDIVIDDGSHVSAQVMVSFQFLFDRVRLGGKYLIEDMAMSYDPAYGGGFRRPGTSVEWAKGFVDGLNFHHIPEQEREDAGDSEALKRVARTR